jgi:hypothetical protein
VTIARNSAYFLIIFATLFTPDSTTAAQWDLGENVVGGAIVDQGFTVDPKYTGTKLILDSQYAFVRKLGEVPADDCCGLIPRAEYFWAVLDAQLMSGVDGTGLEYASIAVSTWGAQWEPKYDETKKLQVLRDRVQLGRVDIGFDDPLGLDSYNELDLVRIDRTWVFNGGPDSLFRVNMGLGLSTGWAWASSIDPNYSDVSNPTTGFLANVSVDIGVFGTLYTDDRIVQGFTLGSPATGSSISREARIRAGYFRRLPKCMAIDVFFEKRSFNFADPVMPDLYTKSKRAGAELSCRFGKT